MVSILSRNGLFSAFFLGNNFVKAMRGLSFFPQKKNIFKILLKKKMLCDVRKGDRIGRFWHIVEASMDRDKAKDGGLLYCDAGLQ